MDITCKLSPLNVVKWKPDGTAQSLRMTLVFTGLSTKNRNLIEQIIEMAKEMELYDNSAAE